MKLATIQVNQQKSVALLSGSQALLFPLDEFPSEMMGWIKGGDSLLAKAVQFAAQGKCQAVAEGAYQLLTPLANPGKIVAIGLNYMDHVREQNVKVPDRPIVFTKFTTAIIGPNDEITWDEQLTSQVDYEVELGVVIGKRARNVPLDEALRYVFGYTVINDVSARDLQFSDHQWVRAKSLDTFCPVGPAILTADEISDPQSLRLSCRLNDRLLQELHHRRDDFWRSRDHSPPIPCLHL